MSEPPYTIGARRQRPAVAGVAIVLVVSHAIILAIGVGLGLWLQ